MTDNDSTITSDNSSETEHDTAIVVGDSDTIDAELAALLAQVEDPAEEPIVATGDAHVDLEEIEMTLVTAELKGNAYGSQEVSAESDVSSHVSTEPVTTPKAASTPRTPRVSNAGKKPSEIVAGWGDEPLARAAMTVTGGDGADDIKTFASVIDGLAKKVGEKAVNLLRNATNGKQLQVYTSLGLKALIAEGEITSKSLFDVMKSVKYKDGTARSQANQLMHLFPALGVAFKTTKSTIAVNRDSEIVKAFAAATA